MKWSTPLPTASIGIRLTGLQFVPSATAEDDVVGRALRLEAAVLPGDVHVAGGVDLGARQRARPQPAGVGVEADLGDLASFDQVAPPSVERNAPIVPLRLSNGTITVPSGCTTG